MILHYLLVRGASGPARRTSSQCPVWQGGTRQELPSRHELSRLVIRWMITLSFFCVARRGPGDAPVETRWPGRGISLPRLLVQKWCGGRVIPLDDAKNGAHIPLRNVASGAPQPAHRPTKRSSLRHSPNEKAALTTSRYQHHDETSFSKERSSVDSM